MAHKKRCGQKTSGNAAPDAQTTQPHLRDEGQVPVLTEVGLGRGQDVVNAGSDDTGRDSHDGDVQDDLRQTSSGPVAAVRPPCGHEDAGEDAQGIGPYRDGTDVPDPC